MRFVCVSHSHPVGATVEKPIPILSCTDLGIVSQGYGDFSLEDLGINRNLSHMLGHPAATCGGDRFPTDMCCICSYASSMLCGWQ